MAKTVSATEAKVRLGAMMEWVAVNTEDIIIEAHGRPKAVLISYGQYEDVLRMRGEATRQDALRRMEALAEQIGERNSDLTDEDVDRLADRFTREVVNELVSEGRVSYKGR
jgi:prevent-host-death family protein